MKVSAGPFQRIYDPSVGESGPWYINDHCFIQDGRGVWHMFGITHAEPADALDEKFLAHATADHLFAPQWTQQAHVLHADRATWQETHVWAPHVIRHDDRYWMYYCAGGADHHRYKIHLATSPDLWQWERHAGNPMVVDGYDARDPMILRHEDRWIMYYTANAEPAGGHFVVASVTSRDLVHWGDKRVVFTHPQRGTFGGPTESPFVVARDGRFYLFVCTNEPYSNTAVYESSDPFCWDIARRVGAIGAHAAEVIVLANGASYVSRAGWGEDGLYLAKLEWSP